MKKPEIKFAANISMLFTEAPFLARIGLAKEAGFSGVEIQFPYAINLSSLSDALQFHDMPLILMNCGVGDLMSGGEGLACIENKRDEFEKALAQCLVYAERLKPKYINILAGSPSRTRDKRQSFEVFCANLNRAIDVFEHTDITVVTELINPIDIPGFYLSNFEIWDQVSKVVDKIKLQFDVYHVRRINEDIIRRFKQYQARIGHVQIADFPDRHEPGTGKINFLELFLTLRALHKEHVGAEYVPKKNTEASLGWLAS